MKRGITYQDLFLSIEKVLSIEKITIVQRPNQHGILQVTAVMDSQTGDDGFYEIPEKLSLGYREGKKKKLLFHGVLSKASMKREGETRLLSLEVMDATYWMDLDQKTRSFQDTSMTTHEVIQEVMKGYERGTCIKNLPEEPIGTLFYQYEETDWEFLCRFFSHYHQMAYPDATGNEIQFQGGLSAVEQEVDWDRLPYRISKNLEFFHQLDRNGFGEVLEPQFLSYQVESYELLPLGSQIRYRKQPWFLGEAKWEIKQGLLVGTYRLQHKNSLVKAKYDNQKLTGVSLSGVVTGVKRNRVQVKLERDLTACGCYWFPFSTVAASSDGSGWHCMPEKGEAIRLYFPTHEEKDAYVIFSVKGQTSRTEHSQEKPRVPQTEGVPREESSGLVPTDQGETKSIQTAQGNQVQFTKGGVKIGAGAAGIELKKNGEVSIHAPGGLSLLAGNEIKLSGKEIHFCSDSEIDLKDEHGTDVILNGYTVVLHGKEVYEN